VSACPDCGGSLGHSPACSRPRSIDEKLEAQWFAAALKEREIRFVQAQLAAALKERDEARAALHQLTAVWVSACTERDRLRAALELTPENVRAIRGAVIRYFSDSSDPESQSIARAVLAAVRARAGLEQLDHVVGRDQQGHQEAAGEHAVADGLGLAVGGHGVDDQPGDADDQRDERNHPTSVGPGQGGGKEGG